jgi:hypothetical protein
MAKRLSPDEKPFRPLEATLIRSVIAGSTDEPAPTQTEPSQMFRHAAPTEEGSAASATPAPQNGAVLDEHRRPSVARRRMTPLLSPLAERMDREKRVLLTPSEDRAVERVVANIGAEFGTSLKLSHVLRSCIRLVINAEDELIERARAIGRTIRPPNSDLPAIEAFEKVVANVLQSGIRSARPIR